MSHRSVGSRVLAAVVVLGLVACGSTEPADGGSPVGIWQSSVPGDFEETIEISNDGTWSSVFAEFDIQECTTDAGTWVAEGAVLSITLTMTNGQASSGGESIPYSVSGDAMTFDPNGQPQTFTRISAMVDCPSYGFPG